MKRNKFLFGVLASGMALAGLTQSCVSDEPFANGDGEGTLRMQLVINSDLTRAMMNEDELKENCVVYLSGAQGLLYKYKGVGELPEQLPLKYGTYVAEAWAGDSVPASFDDRFYRGYHQFAIQDNGIKQVLLECKIANVVVSVDKSTITSDMMTDWNVRVYNSSGSLDYNADTADDAKGYFMMPNADIAYGENGEIRKDSEGWTLYTNLRYEVTGKTLEGKDFKATGLIAGKNYEGNIVEHAHDYTLKFRYNPEYEKLGGSLIEVIIDDKEVEVKVPVGLYSRPAIKGVGFDIEKQVTGDQGAFAETIVKVAGFSGIKSIQLTSDDAETLHLPVAGIDLLNAEENAADAIRQLGIDWDYHDPTAPEKPYTSYLKFSKSYLNTIPEREKEYLLKIFVRDGNNRTNEATLRLAVGKGAIVIDDPVKLTPMDQADLLTVRAKYATVSGTIYSDEANDVQIKYRIAGTEDAWTSVSVNATRASRNFSVKLDGLKPSTQYEYKAVSGDFESPLQYFTTESTFVIPNGDMEVWGTFKSGNKSWALPGAGPAVDFWDTGNGGASTLQATNLTESTSAKLHGGSFAAKLETKAIVGNIAAGNLFVGEFLKANMIPVGASLTFGRPYQGASHPEALRVWVHYTPKAASKDGTYLSKNQLDHGQIYIAFSNGAVNLETHNKKYFDPKSSQILGYGQQTWEGVGYGDGENLKELIIPIDWYPAAATTPPTHIIIVCSASKFGDYMEGGQGSIMYVDDFELVY